MIVEIEKKEPDLNIRNFEVSWLRRCQSPWIKTGDFHIKDLAIFEG